MLDIDNIKPKLEILINFIEKTKNKYETCRNSSIASIAKLKRYKEEILPKFYTDREFLGNKNVLEELKNICKDQDLGYYFNDTTKFWTLAVADYYYNGNPKLLEDGIAGKKTLQGGRKTNGIFGKIDTQIKEFEKNTRNYEKELDYYNNLYIAFKGLIAGVLNNNEISKPIDNKKIFTDLLNVIYGMNNEIIDEETKKELFEYIVVHNSRLQSLMLRNKKKSENAIKLFSTNELQEENNDVLQLLNLDESQIQVNNNIEKTEEENIKNEVITIENEINELINNDPNFEELCIQITNIIIDSGKPFEIEYLNSIEGVLTIYEIITKNNINIQIDEFLKYLQYDNIDKTYNMYKDTTAPSTKKIYLSETKQLIEYYKTIKSKVLVEQVINDYCIEIIDAEYKDTINEITNIIEDLTEEENKYKNSNAVEYQLIESMLKTFNDDLYMHFSSYKNLISENGKEIIQNLIQNYTIDMDIDMFVKIYILRELISYKDIYEVCSNRKEKEETLKDIKELCECLQEIKSKEITKGDEENGR